MEKIKFGETEYNLVPAGTHYMCEQFNTVFVWPEGGSYEDIEASLKDNNRIEILTDNGDLLEVIRGYIHINRLVKQYDYVIGTEQIEDGETESGEPLYINRDVTSTVMIATLKRPDIRETIQNLQDTADTLVMTTLLGGGI